MIRIWLVGVETTGKWWASDRTPSNWGINQDYYDRIALESAHNESQLLMMKRWPKRYMSQARVVCTPGAYLPHLQAPEYIDYHDNPREIPLEVWVIEGAPTRYQALKIAKDNFKSHLIGLALPSAT